MSDTWTDEDDAAVESHRRELGTNMSWQLTIGFMRLRKAMAECAAAFRRGWERGRSRRVDHDDG